MTDTPNGWHAPPGDYAAYLTARLAAIGLSRNALARALGHRGASQVSRWCAGKAVPREKARAKIEAALAGHREPVGRFLSTERSYPRIGDNTPYYDPPETPQNAPGGPIPGGEGYEGAPFVVERYVVEGG